MAQVKLETPFAEIHGSLQKHGIISRQKKYKDERGNVIFEGTQEAYSVRNPRDYKTNPPQGNELRNIEIFREANRLTTEIMHAARYDDADLQAMPDEQRTHIEQLRNQYADYKTRFLKQTQKPDPQAPIDRQTNRPKQYRTLNTFIRALLIQSLKQQ